MFSVRKAVLSCCEMRTSPRVIVEFPDSAAWRTAEASAVRTANEAGADFMVSPKLQIAVIKGNWLATVINIAEAAIKSVLTSGAKRPAP
ncbi:hypothetical protein cym2001_25970 [Pseudomonas sp. CYM-20-01]|nr:hypothetical protein cym2001_25970 [Pseudomonas sp. CYM-20-01]